MNRENVSISLAELHVGECCSVTGVEETSGAAARLLELGLVPGTRIEIRGVAPLGDPMELDVAGYRLSLRRNDARCIRVQRLPTVEPSSSAP